MKKILFTILTVILLTSIYVIAGNKPNDLPEQSTSALRLANTPYKVIMEKRRVSDHTRSTDANGDYSGSATRDFDLYLWRPSTKPEKPQPLLIYSHGFMSHGKGGSYIAEHLAGLGYTVAAPTYPLSNYDAPGGPNAEDVANQPADVSFVIDTLLAENNQSEGEYFGYIDPSRIAAAGLSLGGMTTKLVTFHPRYADQRIKAAVSIAGPSFILAKRFFDGRSIPFMMIATPQDAIVPYEYNAADIQQRIEGATLLTMDGASHAGYSSTAKWLRWFDNPDSLGCRAIAGRVKTKANNDWYGRIGSVEEGVLRKQNPGLCTMNPLPKTMNPLHQHRITTLAVGSFLECQFAIKRRVKDAACDFLYRILSSEHPEISITK